MSLEFLQKGGRMPRRGFCRFGAGEIGWIAYHTLLTIFPKKEKKQIDLVMSQGQKKIV